MKKKSEIMKTIQREAEKFLSLAEKFENAASVCLQKPILQPGAFLTAVSIELYMKSFLLLKFAPTERENTYKKLKQISPKHDLNKILNECIKYDNSFTELDKIIEKYKKYSLFKYPDEIDKIIFGPEEGYEINSREFIDDLGKVGKFITGKYKKMNIST